MNVLLVYPVYPRDAFWAFTGSLIFVAKKAAFPPLGLLTLAAMLPGEWNLRLVDMNVRQLTNIDIKWADYVFVSAMVTQTDSAKNVIRRCNQLGVRVVAGGPVFITGYEQFSGVDHFVLGEAEAVLGEFLRDLQAGCARKFYFSNEHPEIRRTAVPMWSLINPRDYVSLPVQTTRGCPFSCDFCDIIVINGRVPRSKDIEQVLAELDAIYKTGFRGSVFVVDDNFVGNRRYAKELLSEIIKWQKAKKFPFKFFTQASINLADDESLMDLMVQARFYSVFVGIETPSKAGLTECGKTQNVKHNLTQCVLKIQNAGLQVMGGFILGFDSDPSTIFVDMFEFIQETGIVVAMVGILHPAPGTPLYERLKTKGRLLQNPTGDNTDGRLTFAPKMDPNVLSAGYKWLVKELYRPENYHKRLGVFLQNYRPPKNWKGPSTEDFSAVLRSVWYLGIIEKDQEAKRCYWRNLFLVRKCRGSFAAIVAACIHGAHFMKVVEKKGFN